jgi:hypothetical protein
VTTWNIVPGGTGNNSLTTACSQAQPGDVVSMTGTFNVSLTPFVSGSALNPIIFTASAPGAAILNGSGVNGLVNIPANRNYLTFDGLLFTNTNYQTNSLNSLNKGLRVRGNHHVFQNCTMNYMQMELLNASFCKILHNVWREFVGQYDVTTGKGKTAGDMLFIGGGAHDNEIGFNDMKYAGHSVISIGDGFGGSNPNNRIHDNIISNPWYKPLILADDGTGCIIEDNQIEDCNNVPVLLSTLAQNQLPATWPQDGINYASQSIQFSGSNFEVRNNLIKSGVHQYGAIGFGSRWYYDANHPAGVLVESNNNKVHGNRFQSNLGAAVVSFELNYTPGTDPSEPTLTGNQVYDNDIEVGNGAGPYNWDGLGHFETYMARIFKGTAVWVGMNDNLVHDNWGFGSLQAPTQYVWRNSYVAANNVTTNTKLDWPTWEAAAGGDAYNNHADARPADRQIVTVNWDAGISRVRHAGHRLSPRKWGW